MTLEEGPESYVSLDDFEQLSDMLNKQLPIPYNPLPTDLRDYYQGNIPDTTTIMLFQEGSRLGFRTIAPVYYNKNKMGVFVGEVFYTQDMVDRYALLSKTDINLFAGMALSVGTLQAQTRLASDTAEQMITCENLLNRQMEPAISLVTIDGQEYYQGQCSFLDSADHLVGATTVNLSREIELQRMSKIMTAVFTISGVGILVCIVLVFGLIVPRFTDPIITLTEAAYNIRCRNISYVKCDADRL